MRRKNDKSLLSPDEEMYLGESGEASQSPNSDSDPFQTGDDNVFLDYSDEEYRDLLSSDPFTTYLQHENVKRAMLHMVCIFAKTTPGAATVLTRIFDNENNIAVSKYIPSQALIDAVEDVYSDEKLFEVWLNLARAIAIQDILNGKGEIRREILQIIQGENTATTFAAKYAERDQDKNISNLIFGHYSSFIMGDALDKLVAIFQGSNKLSNLSDIAQAEIQRKFFQNFEETIPLTLINIQAMMKKALEDAVNQDIKSEKLKAALQDFALRITEESQADTSLLNEETKQKLAKIKAEIRYQKCQHNLEKKIAANKSDPLTSSAQQIILDEVQEAKKRTSPSNAKEVTDLTNALAAASNADNDTQALIRSSVKMRTYPWGKRIADTLLALCCISLIAASITFGVMTMGTGMPITIAGVGLGVAALASITGTGCAIGLGGLALSSYGIFTGVKSELRNQDPVDITNKKNL